MALEDTTRSLAPGLLRFCLGRCDDPASAEDIAQECLAALVRRWKRLGPPDDPTAFVYAIARRRIWRWRSKRRLLAPLSALGEPTAPMPADGGQVARQRLVEVRRLFARLTSREQQALLVSLDGMSSRQAAAALGIRASTYKMRLHRARRRLRTLLEELDGTT